MPTYCVSDEPMTFDVPDEVEGIDYGLWDIPKINYKKKYPRWYNMSKTERNIIKLTSDPFLFHTVVLGYDKAFHQGEWLWKFHQSMNIHIAAPVDFGKSCCGSVSFPLFSYGRNCNIRCCLISCSKDLTIANMREINVHLTQNPRFIEFFNRRWGANPKPTGDDADTWSKSEKMCYRTRPVGARDVTFYGLGLLGATWGRRVDLLILDDFISPQDFYTGNESVARNIITELEEVLTTRLEPDGTIKSIGTFHDRRDTYNHIIKNHFTSWDIVRYKAINMKGDKHFVNISDIKRSEAVRKLNGEEVKPVDFLTDGMGVMHKAGDWWNHVSDKTHYSLWPEKWSIPKLIRRGKMMSSDAFCKRYQCALSTDTERDFHPMWIAGATDAGKDIEIYPDGSNNIKEPVQIKIIGLDLASGSKSKRSKYVCLVVLAVTPGGLRIPIWMDRGKFEFPEQKRLLLKRYAGFNPNSICVENNATQDSLRQEIVADKDLCSEMGISTNLPIRGVFTGSNKNSVDEGIPILTGLFEHGYIVIPSGNKFARDMFEHLVTEIETYPGDNTDCVMALWFAELEARKRHGFGQKFASHINVLQKRIVEPANPMAQQGDWGRVGILNKLLRKDEHKGFRWSGFRGSSVLRSVRVFAG